LNSCIILSYHYLDDVEINSNDGFIFELNFCFISSTIDVKEKERERNSCNT